MSPSRFFLHGVISLLLTVNLLIGSPAITGVSPNHGPAAGGTGVTITGTGFTGVTQVKFGPTAAPVLTSSDTEITTTAPKSVPGTVHISVTVGADTSPTSPADRYTYQGNWFAYVSGTDSDDSPKAWYIDLGDTTHTGDIALFSQNTPWGIAITPDGRAAYVGDNGNVTPNTTYVNAFDLVYNTPSSIECDKHWYSDFIAISPDGNTAFSTFRNENSVGQIDVATNHFMGTIATTETSPEGIAISRDGHKIYVANSNSYSVSAITLGGGATTISLPKSPLALAITPNGSEVYVTTYSNEVFFINTTSNTATPISIPGTTLYGIAISPDGGFVYVTDNDSSNVYQIKTSTKDVVGPIHCCGDFLTGIAIAPDGKKAYVNNYENSVYVIDLTTDPPGATGAIPIPNNGGLNFIAITPDPAPAADFSVTTGTAGSSTQFDASSSVSPVGTIVTYAWNFGDGTLTTTSDPLTSHTYATAGTYNVELTVTNSAGTSVTQTFTGQTVSNAGSEENAHITKSVVISPPIPEPPPRFCGKVKKHHHHLLLKTEWTPSPSPNIVGYKVYKKHTLLRTTPSLCFKKTLHPKDYYKHHLHAYKQYLEKLYKVRTVNSGAYKSIFTPLDIN